MGMQTLILVTVLEVILVSPGLPQNPRLPAKASTPAADYPLTVSKYDKFKDHTGVSFNARLVDPKVTNLEKVGSTYSIELFAGYGCKGNVDHCPVPIEMFMIFAANSKDWHFQKYSRRVTLLLDGRRLELGDAGWDGSVISGEQVLEQMDVDITPTQLAAIGDASTVECQLGSSTTFTLTKSLLKALRQLSARQRGAS